MAIDRPADKVPGAPGFDRVGQRLTEHVARFERELGMKGEAQPSGKAGELAAEPKSASARGPADEIAMDSPDGAKFWKREELLADEDGGEKIAFIIDACKD